MWRQDAKWRHTRKPRLPPIDVTHHYSASLWAFCYRFWQFYKTISHDQIKHIQLSCMGFLFSDVSLTVRLSITLANDQFDAQIFNTFITILYMYMFRAISCSSSGGQIVLIQLLVSSLSVSERPVHLCTGRSKHVQDCNKYIKNLCIKLVIA